MFGTDVTYLLGSVASKQFWSASNDNLNAEDLYKNITVPVFGKGVAFDVPNRVFSEQKSMAKSGLTQERFAKYTAMIEEECRNYLERWGDEGEANLHEAMAEMIVFTATRCLHGQETRDAFTEDVANLYSDLDGGFSPQAWFLPPWLPLPSFRARDKAHVELKKRFHAVVESRRAQQDAVERADLLETFLTARYAKVNEQRQLNNDEISGLLIALLMAGQHTSSTTSSWFGFFMADCEDLQDRLYEEQKAAIGTGFDAKITVDHLAKMPLLHSCVRETLRLRPPIMQMMRRVRKKLEVTVGEKTYEIPVGNQVCVSPSVNGRNRDEWADAETFKPERFLDPETGEVTDHKAPHLHTNGSANEFSWVPFGAGRHRCIGFEFAQLQIRVVWSTLLRLYEIKNKAGVPAVNYRTMIHTPLEPFVTYKRRV